MYDRLEEYSRRIMKSEPVILTVAQRAAACNAMVEKLIEYGVRVIALSVGAKHYHILAQFPDTRVRHWVGLAKKHASHILSEFGLPGACGRESVGLCPLSIVHIRSIRLNTYSHIASRDRAYGRSGMVR